MYRTIDAATGYLVAITRAGASQSCFGHESVPTGPSGSAATLERLTGDKTGDAAATRFNVGLTGGIGSGKSEVLRRFAAFGATVADADLAARRVVEPGTDGFDEVVKEFGDGVVGPDGALDREALGAIVFADPARLAALEAIVHPRVGVLMAEWAAAVPEGGVLVYDVPLLVEHRLNRSYDVIVVVDADDETRFARLAENRGMSREAAAARMAAQASREDRLAAADFVITNSGSLADLDAEAERVWRELLVRRDSRIR